MICAPNAHLNTVSLYDPVGNRTRVVEADGSVVTWSYDPTYQLTNEQRSGSTSYKITYAYDGVGNRTLLDNSGSPITYRYNAANELATSQTNTGGVTTYAFDGDGNLLKTLAPGAQLTTNTWDGENRLTNVALPSGIVDTFTYNGDGQRVQKEDSTGTTNHIWDGQNILLETNGGDLTQAVYTLEPARHGNLISQVRSGVTSFYLFDALGSARQLASGGGSTTDSYACDSYGNSVQLSGSTPNPFRYLGRLGYYFDIDTALFDIRTMAYDSQLGRFVLRDLSPTIHSNAYLYSGNNPVNRASASGRRKSGKDKHVPPDNPCFDCAVAAVTTSPYVPDVAPGTCNVSLCCRGLCGSWLLSSWGYKHCFILVTTDNLAQIYYSGQPGRKAKNCKEALVVHSGGYGTGAECFLRGTECYDMGAHDCAGPDSVLNCLQEIANWFNTELLCYDARNCPNSNTVAFTLAAKCTKRPPPPDPPTRDPTVPQGDCISSAPCYGIRHLPPGSGTPVRFPAPPNPVPYV